MRLAFGFEAWWIWVTRTALISHPSLYNMYITSSYRIRSGDSRFLTVYLEYGKYAIAVCKICTLLMTAMHQTKIVRLLLAESPCAVTIARAH